MVGNVILFTVSAERQELLVKYIGTKVMLLNVDYALCLHWDRVTLYTLKDTDLVKRIKV